MNHILYAVVEVAEVIHARVFLAQPEAAIKTLLTDSRKIVDPRSALFFALQGRRDGHTFIQEAHKAGVRNFVISDPGLDRGPYPDSNFLLVEDTLQALQALAADTKLVAAVGELLVQNHIGIKEVEVQKTAALEGDALRDYYIHYV